MVERSGQSTTGKNQFEPIKGSDTFSDRRARLSAKPDARKLIYGDNLPENIMRPLWETGGMLWPYTPIISDLASVQYDSYDPVHTNQPYMAFKSVAAKEIMCTGQFTAMNQDEAEYCIASIHFLRTITKMYFGTGSENKDTSAAAISLRGTPPPVLLFNAHGTAMFHNVPVIVTSYSIEFPQDVDYVEVKRNIIDIDKRTPRNIVGTIDTLNQDLSRAMVSRVSKGISAWVPTRFTITVNMTVQNSPNRLRRNFNLNDFRTGDLIKYGGWV